MSSPRPFLAALVVAVPVALLSACGSDGPSAATVAAPAKVAATATSAATTSTDPPGSGSVTSNLRDIRYCEVIPSVQQATTVSTYVYNTLGQNYCPPENWSQLTEDEVNTEFGSQSAELNGPRHWVMDSIEGSGASTTGESFTFGGIAMNLRATLTTAAGQPTVGQEYYTPNQVARDTVFTYDAGKTIFTLTSPEGDVYVMQSYAQIVDPTLTMKQLPDLATKLTLPTGWTYSSQTLTEDLVLNSNGLATVVNDNLADSYQKR